jgi:expansin
VRWPRAVAVALLSLPFAVAACGASSSEGSGPFNPNPGNPVPVGAEKRGKATFYDATGEGNCSFDASPKDLLVVAPNKQRHYAGSALCGACLEVTGSKGSVVVRVVDSCPVDTPDNDCGDTGADLDLSAQAFAKVDDPDKGIVDVTFKVVACEVTGPMSYKFKDGSSEFYTAIQVRNHRLPIAKLEYERDGAFVDMPREDDNFFVAQKGVGKVPGGLKLRVTASTGQVVTDTLPRVEDNKVVAGGAQF